MGLGVMANVLRCRFVAVAAILLAGVSSVADAASPQLSNILPRGGQSGTELDVRFVGARLSDAQELLIYQPGIEVLDLQVPTDKDGKPVDNQVQAKLRIAADCPSGVKYFRVRTASGVSDLRTFFVGPLPIAAETEPNSDFAAPQAVAMNTTVEGIIQSEDVDYFVVEAKQGDRLSAEVEGLRLGNTMFDPYVAILNEARFELVASDDMALLHQDGVVSLVVPEDGRYIVMVRESSYGGNGASHYRCHIGSFPRPIGLVPSGGKPGELVNVTFLGDVKGARDQQIQLPAEVVSEFGVFAQDEQGIAPSWNSFRLSPLDNTIEQEPNADVATATVFAAPGAVNGVLMEPGDIDHFKFTATKGQVFDVQLYGRQLRSSIDSVLSILDANGRQLAANDDQGGIDSYIRFTVPADGDFVIRVADHLGGGGPDYFYRVELTTIEPDLKLAVNEFQRYVEPKITVHRGNLVPVVLAAQRKDFGGPLAISSTDLPPGVTIESMEMAADQNVVQVLFRAAADAPVGGKLSEIIGTLNDPNQQRVVTGKVHQEVVLIRGQNNRPFWVEPTHRVPVVVAEEVPYTLELVQPQVPVVQGGSMQLKILAHRQEGFTAPIKVELLWNPPGMNSSRTVSIAEGQSEAVIAINAAGNAPAREWPLAARGEADLPTGRVTVATPFINLRIAEQYLKFAYTKSAIEQGQESELYVTVEQTTPFEGAAKVTLLGLPNKVTSEPIEVTKDAKELTFKIKAEADAPPTTAKNLFCQVIVMENGEPVLHNLGSGELRVDKPLPQVAAAPMPEPKKEEPKAAPAPKRLSRLEQLRLQQQERLKQQGGSQ